MAYRAFSGSGRRLVALLTLATVVVACSKFFGGPPSEADIKSHLPERYQKDLQVVRIHPGIEYGRSETHDVGKCLTSAESNVFPVLITYTSVKSGQPCPLAMPFYIRRFNTCGSGTEAGVLQGFCFFRASDGSWAAGVAAPSTLIDPYQDWK